VDVLHVAPGTGTCDSRCCFAKDKVLHLIATLFFNGSYPFIDVLAGGFGARLRDELDSHS